MEQKNLYRNRASTITKPKPRFGKEPRPSEETTQRKRGKKRGWTVEVDGGGAKKRKKLFGLKGKRKERKGKANGPGDVWA